MADRRSRQVPVLFPDRRSSDDTRESNFTQATQTAPGQRVAHTAETLRRCGYCDQALSTAQEYLLVRLQAWKLGHWQAEVDVMVCCACVDTRAVEILKELAGDALTEGPSVVTEAPS